MQNYSMSVPQRLVYLCLIKCDFIFFEQHLYFITLVVPSLNHLSLLTQKGNDPSKSGTILHEQTVLGIWLGKKEVQNLSQPVQLKFINTKQVR